MSSVRTIGRYKIERELGRGGMAYVYLAHDPLMQRQVAIKVLPRQLTFQTELRQRFEFEVHTVAALEHRAIVPVYDVGEHEEQPYLVMRYMTGGSLRSRLSRLTLAETAVIFTRLAAGLDKAHERGIIHRDMKPDNVLLDGDGRAYLADFGIARAIEGTNTMTAGIGTASYMSPEQIKGEKLDGRSDIYALGVMLFEILVGQLPYQSTHPYTLMTMHVQSPIPNLLALKPDLPAAWQAVINKAMAKTPAERYATARELAAAVTALANQRPVEEKARLKATMEAEKTVVVPPVRRPKLNPQLQRPVEKKAPPKVPMEAEETVVVTPVTPAIMREPPIGRLKTGPQLQLGNRRWWVGGGVVGLLLLLLAWQLWGGSASGPGGSPTATPERALLAAVASTATPERIVVVVTATNTPTLEATDTPERIVVVVTATNTPTPEATDTPTPPPLKPGDERIREKDGMVLVYVPGGSFLMGSDPAQDPDAQNDELPQHEVTLTDNYWMDQTEVTNAQFATFVAETDHLTTAGRNINGQENHPVASAFWNDADAYCRWAGGQLPTEAQWEYAARGDDGRLYPWGNEAPNCRLAQFGDCSGSTVSVGSFSLAGDSWVGAADMAGNVWEWTQDWYDGNYYDNSPVSNPSGPQSGTYKVLRGGSWNDYSLHVRAANRNIDNPDYRNVNIGFRCVVPPGP